MGKLEDKVNDILGIKAKRKRPEIINQRCGANLSSYTSIFILCAHVHPMFWKICSWTINQSLYKMFNNKKSLQNHSKYFIQKITNNPSIKQC